MLGHTAHSRSDIEPAVESGEQVGALNRGAAMRKQPRARHLASTRAIMRFFALDAQAPPA
jgi:hypothetical protein